jgi:acyl-CoA thioester hydrolase
MAKNKIQLPAAFSYQTDIPIRITDLNYGGHVGNDTVLSLIHEARVRALASKGFNELKIGNAGLIMTDVAIEYKAELFYGDIVKASICFTEFSKIGFEVYYILQKEHDSRPTTVAIARTGMVCYDYDRKKIVTVPPAFRAAMETIN